MRLLALGTLATFWERHPETKAPLQRWASLIRAGTWQSMAELQDAFAKSGKALNGERMRFDVGGGDYRLIAAFKFPSQIAFVKFVGSHAEYDRIDALTIALF